MVALTAGPGMLKATNLLQTYAANGSTVITSVTLNCSTTSGGGASATIVVKPLTALTGSNTISVTASSLPAAGGNAAGTPNALTGTGSGSVTITPPAIQTLGATASGTTALSLTYTVSLTNTAAIGCQGVTAAAPTFSFNHVASGSSAVVADAGMTVNTTVNGGVNPTASALTTSVATVNLTCQKVGSSYFPGPAQTVTVGSGATGGTPFALDSGSPAASWVTYPTPIPNLSVASANSQVAFTVQAGSTCGGNPVSATPVTSTISLASTLLGAGVSVSDKTITVNLVVSGPSASTLTTSLSTINLTCILSSATYYPSGAQTESIGTSLSSNPFTTDVTNNALPSWLALNGANAVVSGSPTNSVPVTFTVQAASGCGGLPVSSTAVSYTLSLNSTGLAQSEKQIVINLTVSGPSASALVVNPSPITVTCVQAGSAGSYTYSPNYAQTVSVTSPAAGGTAFTITSPGVSWLSISSLAGGTASTSAVTFTLQATGTCNAGVGTTVSVHLANAPNLDKQFAVTLQIVPAAILVPTPIAASFTYVKGSGSAGFADVSLASSSTTTPTPYFSVNGATLPSWLRTDVASGNAPRSIRFSSTSVADTLSPGTYAASVVISVSGYGDTTIPVSMLLTNKAAQLSIEGPTTVPLTWVIGQGLPTPTITAISTDTPIAYTATTGGSLAPVIAAGEQSGLAYSFGTPIQVSFSPQVFAGAQPGNILTGTVTLNWGSPVSTIVVTFDITVVSPGATITSMYPASLPVGTPSYTVSIVGTGFVTATGQATRVGVVTTPGAAMTFDPAMSANVINGSNITLTLTVPNGASSIPFAGGNVTIGVCNPVGGVACTVATASSQLSFGSNPIIQGVTSSSSLLEGGSLALAPYDMVSIFGANFCPNCTTNGAGSILTGSPDPVTLTYPTSLAFDGSHSLWVTFQPHTGGGATNFTPAQAPILFATDTQINLTVPSVVPTGLVDVVVSYGSLTGSPAPAASPIYTVTIATTDPGIFTVGADGQGSGAILDANYNLVSSTNPAGIRTTATSDTISIYVTGMGAPDSTAVASTPASDNNGNGYLWSHDCASTSSYLTAFNAAQTGTALNTLDGTLIIPSVLATGNFVPCIKSTDGTSVSIGGQTLTPSYVGWVPGTIAGLYQINVTLPTSTGAIFTNAAGLTNQALLAPMQMPVSVSLGGKTSQTGVSVWVKPSLAMTGPSSGTGANTVAAQVGVPLPSTNNSVTVTSTNPVQGTGNITYTVTSGLLPSGLSLNASSGLISGTPAIGTQGTYTVTVTATDSAQIPVTGTNTFVLTVADGLFTTVTGLTTSVYGSGPTTMATVSAANGVFPYTYTISDALNGGTALPGTLTVGSSSGVVATTSATPAGVYEVGVLATDSTSGTHLTGTAYFNVVVNLHVVSASTGTVFSASGTTYGAANTVTTTGGAGGYTYSLDAPGTALLAANSTWLSFNTSTGVFTVAAGLVQGTYNFNVTATAGTTPGNSAAAPSGTATITVTVGS